MHSPPPCHPSLNHPYDDETAHDFDDHQRLRTATLNDLPPYVSQDVLITESYRALDAAQIERDRRLRLLIRRYTNQIQYGCRNKNCTVRTCLSYRRRNTKGALRPYTDLSARSLACQLVDECSKAGRDPRYGLCPNQPVVPWYHDPEYERQRRLPEKSTTGLPVKPKRRIPALPRTRSLPRASDIDGLEHAGERDADHQAISKSVPTGRDMDNLTESVPEEDRKTVQLLVDELRKLDEAPPEADEQKAKSDRQLNFRATSTVLQTHTVRSRLKPQEVPHVAERKDHASFVQMLWDTQPLRALSRLTGTLRRPSSDLQSLTAVSPGKNIKHEIPGPEEKKDALDNDRDGKLLASPKTNTTFCGLTLQRLSWRTLNWLCEKSLEQEGDPEQSFEKFVQQSILYTLGDPRRLHLSAKSWTDSAGPEAEYETNQPLSPDRDHPSTTRPSEETRTDVSVPEPKEDVSPFSSVDALVMLAAITKLSVVAGGMDVVYDGLHTMVQQCYKYASSAEDIDKNNRLALKSLKRSGGGLWTAADMMLSASQHHLSRKSTADVLLITLLAMLTPLLKADLLNGGLEPLVMRNIQHIRNRGLVYPQSVSHTDRQNKQMDVDRHEFGSFLIRLIDHCEDWHLYRLSTSLTDCLSHHLAAAEIRRTQKPMTTQPKRQIIDLMLNKLFDGFPKHAAGVVALDVRVRATIAMGITEIVRSIMLKDWDREPVVRRTSPVGGALELLAAVYRRADDFFLEEKMYHMPFIAEAFNAMEMPTKWL